MPHKWDGGSHLDRWSEDSFSGSKRLQPLYKTPSAAPLAYSSKGTLIALRRPSVRSTSSTLLFRSIVNDRSNRDALLSPKRCCCPRVRTLVLCIKGRGEGLKDCVVLLPSWQRASTTRRHLSRVKDAVGISESLATCTDLSEDSFPHPIGVVWTKQGSAAATSNPRRGQILPP